MVHPPDPVGSQARSHGLDTLALAGQQQPGAVRLQGSNTIRVPCGLRQAIEVCRKAFLLGPAWRRDIGAHGDTVQRTILPSTDLLGPGIYFITQ